MSCPHCFAGFVDARHPEAPNELCPCTVQCRDCDELAAADEAYRGRCGECAAILGPRQLTTAERALSMRLSAIVAHAARMAFEGRDTIPAPMCREVA